MYIYEFSLAFLRGCGVGRALLPSLGDGRVGVGPADVDAVPEDGGGRRGGLAGDALVKVDQLLAVVQDVVRVLALQQAVSVLREVESSFWLGNLTKFRT